jgi:hypothetical protein
MKIEKKQTNKEIEGKANLLRKQRHGYQRMEDGWEELVNLVLGRWLRAAQQQAASYEPNE